jgi:hypothetical protein
MKLTIFTGLCLLALTLAAPTNQDLKNGPAGSQSAAVHKSNIDATHSSKTGQASNAQLQTGGSQAQVQTGSKTLVGSKGSGQVAANNGGSQASGSHQGDVNSATGGQGKVAEAKKIGDHQQALSAGGKQIQAQASNGAAKATHGNEYNANFAGSSGVAATGNKQVKVDRADKNMDVDVTGPKGKKIDAQSTKNGNAKVVDGRKKYETIQTERGSNSQTQLKVNGKEKYAAKSYAQGKNSFSAIKTKGRLTNKVAAKTDNSVNLYPASGSRPIASLKAKKMIESECTYTKKYTNLWKEPDFKIYEEDIKVEVESKVNANGEEVYEWPACMNVQVPVNIPAGVSIADLAASMVLYIPGCGAFQCSKEHKCLGRDCFYDDLCASDYQPAGEQHKDFVDWGFATTRSNACNLPSTSSRRHTLEYRYCPDVNGKLENDTACMKNNMFLSQQADMELFFHIYSVNKRPLECELNNANKNNVVLRGCRHVQLEWQVKGMGMGIFESDALRAPGKVLLKKDEFNREGLYLGTDQSKVGKWLGNLGGGSSSLWGRK